MVATLLSLLCLWAPGISPDPRCPLPPTSGIVEYPEVYLPVVAANPFRLDNPVVEPWPCAPGVICWPEPLRP